MPDVSLVPVEHQPEFDNVSLVPVEHDPYSDDTVTPKAQSQQGQPQAAQPEPPAIRAERLYVSPPAKNPQASEPTPSIASTPQPPAPTQDGFDRIPGAMPPSEPTPTPQQVLQGAINQFYPGAQFSGLAQQAYKNGQYGNAIGYGVGALADSLLALGGGKLLGAGLASLKGIAGASWPLRRALERAGHVFQAGHATHHIAAKLAKRAGPAQLTLQRLGIDIHDAANGVFLPRAQHGTLHTDGYYEAVNKALEGAKSKAEAKKILRSIARRLQSDTFP